MSLKFCEVCSNLWGAFFSSWGINSECWCYCALYYYYYYFLSIPPSLPSPFSADFISVTAACFPPLSCGAHGCPKQTVLTMGVPRVAVSLVPWFKIQSSKFFLIFFFSRGLCQIAGVSVPTWCMSTLCWMSENIVMVSWIELVIIIGFLHPIITVTVRVTASWLKSMSSLRNWSFLHRMMRLNTWRMIRHKKPVILVRY